MRMYCGDWAATYGNPYVEPPTPDDDRVAPVVEDGGELRARDVPATSPADTTLIFVDGVRRMEASLTAEEQGSVVRGVAGAHGVGAVVFEPAQLGRFERCATRRYLVWEGDGPDLPAHPAGFSWESTRPGRADTSAEAELQNLMREGERELAEDLCGEGREWCSTARSTGCAPRAASSSAT